MITTTTTGGACPLCGIRHAVCGQATTTTPVDIPIGKGATTVATSRYRVTIAGQQRTLKLSAEDAKQYEGAELVDSDAPDTEQADGAEAKTRTAANKARRPAANKQQQE